MGSSAAHKKRRMMIGQPKNALTHLNELRPGARFEVTQQHGATHSPVFVCSVEVNGQVCTVQCVPTLYCILIYYQYNSMTKEALH